MSYQYIFIMYLIATTLNSLLMRRYAVRTALHPMLSGILTNAVISLPIALIYVLVTGSFTAPTLKFALAALVEAMAGSAYGVVALYAQKHADASTFATLIKAHVAIVVIMSSIFLAESLSIIQMVGTVFLVSSGAILSKGIHKRGLLYALAALPLLSLVVIFGRIVVRESNVGMYLVTASILGLLIKLAVKGHEFRSNLPEIKAEFKQRSVLSVVTFLQIALFVISVDRSDNVSLISSLASLKVITVMIASYLFMGERSNIQRKIAASALSIIGLLLI